ncbi:hypothetical protein AgCh_034196 [Apium graveolens]
MRKNNHTYGSRNFLGINQFYERFVRDFAKISGPLIRPTCKMEKVVWNEKCEESFQELKRSLVSALVLALPDGKGKANVVADALSSKERLKMLTTPEELVRELEEMEIEVKSLEEKTNEERESLTEKKSNVRKMRREL